MEPKNSCTKDDQSELMNFVTSMDELCSSLNSSENSISASIDRVRLFKRDCQHPSPSPEPERIFDRFNIIYTCLKDISDRLSSDANELNKLV